MKKLLLNAPGRIRRSFGYSWDAFKSTVLNEESFRLELLGLAILIVCLALSPWPLWKCLAQAAAFQIILFAEILNSALENICDGITREQTQFVKEAKDKGALAVLMAIIFNALVLATLLFI